VLCVPSARHVFGTASLASSALSASAELLVLLTVALDFRPEITISINQSFICIRPMVHIKEEKEIDNKNR